MDCSTRLLDWDRWTGMPPSHWKRPLKGLRNMAVLPIHCIRALKAKAISSVKGKSQFDVWGAPTRTNLGIRGSCPSVRHPARLKTKRAARCKIVSSPGVLNIVWFTIALVDGIRFKVKGNGCYSILIRFLTLAIYARIAYGHR